MVKEKFNVQTLSGARPDPDKKNDPEELLEAVPVPMQKYMKISF